jgi:micrococcal nuclease
MSLYTYRATLARIVDGDTVDLNVDCGFKTWRRDRFRLAGINCPEMSTPEGEVAYTAAAVWFVHAGAPFYVQTLRDRQEKYGRYLAWVYAGTVQPAGDAPVNQAQADAMAEAEGDGCLNVALVRGGQASWYWGGARG